MPYKHHIPDAPIAGSMLPRASELTLDDLLVLIQPGNPIGQKNKALVLSMLADWLADGNMGPFKAFIFNDTSRGITLSPSNGSHLRRSFTIPSYAAVQVVCSGQHVYVVGGEYA